METNKLLGACAFGTGLAITLFLAAYLTPREWWRRPNLRALLITVGGAWGFGSLLLWIVPPAAVAGRAAPAAVASTAPITAAASADTANADAEPIAGHPFRTHRSLNLRSAPGVQSPLLLTVPAGASVTPTGARRGDWWQISATIEGQDSTGWVSSLWLRRSGE